MAKQQELFDGGDTPKFEPFHFAFRGKARVLKSRFASIEDHYIVNLNTGVCSCEWGEPFLWDNEKEKFIHNKYCVHKLKAMADIVQQSRDAKSDAELEWAYVKAVASRYNRFEVVSAFHKELRRGDLERAIFFGNLLIANRGTKGVLTYLLEIVYEETRDHELALWLLQVVKNFSDEATSKNYANVCRGIAWFCKTKKKWELSHRMPIFESEMHAYNQLLKDFGVGVAGHGNYIPRENEDYLVAKLIKGIKTSDLIEAQYGLKGLQKIKIVPDKLREYRVTLAYKILDASFAAKQGDFFKYLLHKRAVTGIGYHDLNTFLDLTIGEPYDAGLLPDNERKVILRRPKVFPFPLGKYPPIPLYAHDNHTWYGKGLIRRFPAELQPGSKQKKLDLRYCGAYFGVAWRMLAYQQHQSTDVTWESVKWPRKLYNAVSQLWY